MSGIEVAGLLLGAFPLLISALEHYRQSEEVLEDWWQIKKEYKKCKNELLVQELAFEKNLERFLLPLVVGDDEIAALIDEPGGMKWKDPALEDKLKSRLPKSYELFLDTIQDIKSTVDGLEDELGVSREAFQKGLNPEVDQKRTRKSRNLLKKLLNRQKQEASTESAEGRWKKWLSRPNIEYQTHRVKFGFGRANRAKLFKEFAGYNARLRELLDTSDKSAELEQSRRQIKNSIVKKSLWKVWRHAANLHNLLGQAWCCQCRHMHRACLLLHHETNLERIEFSICFLYAPSPVAHRCPWSWKEVNAQHIGHDVPEADLSVTVPQNSVLQPSFTNSSLKTSTRTPVKLDPLFTPRKVKWKAPPSPAADVTNRTTGHRVVTDLCSTIATCDPASNVFGLLQGDEDSYVLQRGAKTRPPGEAYQTVSLETLLNRSSGFHLDRRQRYGIAYTLASSHLQLYPSPWLHSHWSKKDIIFNVDPQDPRSIHIDQPYMLHAVSTQGSPSTSSYASSDRSLPTLGILLIELCFGTPLEDHEMWQQCHSTKATRTPSPDLEATLNFAVALEWAGSVYGEAGETYADAVNWCLRGQFPGNKDDQWRRELFANVVRPLQTCHEQMHPTSREDWLKPGLGG